MISYAICNREVLDFKNLSDSMTRVSKMANMVLYRDKRIKTLPKICKKICFRGKKI